MRSICPKLLKLHGPGRSFAYSDDLGTRGSLALAFTRGDQGQITRMIGAENIRDWRDHDVVDPDGRKIGQLEGIYVDTSTDEPTFASVRTGMIGRHRLTFVPLDRATVAPDSVRVAYARGQVKGAPAIDTDGELAATDEPALFAHYGIPYQLGAGGERRLARR